MLRDRFRQIRKYFLLFNYDNRANLIKTYGNWYQVAEFRDNIIENSNKYYRPG